MWGGDKSDLESGEAAAALLPEYPQHRWAFIRKVYSIITIQLLLTIAVSAAVIYVHPIFNFFAYTWAGAVVFSVITIIPFISLCFLCFYSQRHPFNYLLLALFTLSLAFTVGTACAFTNGKVIMEAAILTATVTISLTLYTFWASKRGQDFSFLGPFLSASLCLLIVFSLIQILIPFGSIGAMIYGCLGSLIFAGYIVYDTENLIKRYSYDEYIWASIALYLDILNLFLMLLRIFGAADRNE